jgi:hypothetical protein
MPPEPEASVDDGLPTETLTIDMLAADMLAPAYGPDSLAAVLPAAVGALDVDLTTATGLRSVDCTQGFGLPAADHVVVVICDGLGYGNLVERAGHAPFMRAHLTETRQLRTCFPATTAAALAVFGTGTAPGLTGMLGYTVGNPNTGSLVNLVQWAQQADPRDAAADKAGRTAPAFAANPLDFQREPTCFETATTAGVTVTTVGKSRFAASGMTLAALRGGGHVGADSLTAQVDATVRCVRAARGGKSLTYLYTADADKAAHAHGWYSPQWVAALEAFDGELARLTRSLPAGTLVIMTADHGQVQADPSQRIDVANEPDLARDVALVAGEARAVHVYASDGVNPDTLAARWRVTLGDRAIVATRDQAIAAGWLGPTSVTVPDRIRPWIGDLLIAPTRQVTIVDSRTQTPASIALKGVHGSMTELEMTIPLITAVSGT